MNENCESILPTPSFFRSLECHVHFVREETNQIFLVEKASYPADEYASEETIQFRANEARQFFLVCMSNEGEVAGFINGTLTTSKNLDHDAMSTHDPNGSNLCIHSVCVEEGWRRRKVATNLLRHYVRIMKHLCPSLPLISLICKRHLIPFYQSCGFHMIGPSLVVWGKDNWFELQIDLERERRAFFQVDAFTSLPFRGNPAGVVLFSNGDDEEWMQRVASEINVAETAFICPLPVSCQNQEEEEAAIESEVHFSIRWFSPVREVGEINLILIKISFIICLFE